jgi:hypothetical protein
VVPDIPGGFDLQVPRENTKAGTPREELHRMAKGQSYRESEDLEPAARNVVPTGYDPTVSGLYGVHGLVSEASIDPRTGITKHQNSFMTNPVFGGAAMTEPQVSMPIHGPLVPHVTTPTGAKSQTYSVASMLKDPEARRALQDMGISYARGDKGMLIPLEAWYQRMGWETQK